MSSIKQLRERRGNLQRSYHAILDRAEKENRSFTAEERTSMLKIVADDEDLRDRIRAQESADNLDTELDRSVGDSRLAPTNASADPRGWAGASPGHRQPLFRDQGSGEIVRGLRHHDSFADPQARNAAFDADDDGERDLPPIGDWLVAKLTGRVSDRDAHRYKNLGESDSSGGVLLEPQFGAGFIDLARSASVCSRAGAVTLRLDRAEMIFAALTSDPVSTWRYPGTTVPSSDISLSRIVMHPRTLSCVIPVQIELIEDAPNAGVILQHSLAASMGLALDQAALGVNAPAAAKPVGLMNTAGINTIASVGTPGNYQQIGAAVTDILSANYPGEPGDLAWCLHPRDAETFDKLVDTLGQPMRPTPFAAAVKRFHTTSFPTNGGESTNQSSMVVGSFDQMVIGMRTTGVNIRVLESGMFVDSAGVAWEAATSLQRLVVAYLRADAAVLRPTWFTVLQGVTNT